MKVLFVVMRKTYGYNKSTDDMTNSQLIEACDLDKSAVSKTISELKSMRVLNVSGGKYGYVLGVNKHYKKWIQLSKQQQKSVVKITTSCQNNNNPELLKRQQVVVKTTTGGCQNNNSELLKRQPQKTIPKDNSKRQLQKTLAARPPPRSAEKKSADKKKSKTADVWSAYSAAYFSRYGVDPVRNLTVNSQLSNFIKRVPLDEAPHIAAFYVTHNDMFYLKKGHAVGQLLADAEKLRTEWATNRTITTTRARQVDEKQSNFDVVQEALRLDEQEGRL